MTEPTSFPEPMPPGPPTGAALPAAPLPLVVPEPPPPNMAHPATADPERFVGLPIERVFDELQLSPPQYRRAVWRPLFLFLATCFTTFCAGCYGWDVAFLWDGSLGTKIAANWRQGLIYMACVMGVLLAHEMGHFLMTVRYRIHASFPIFLPVPVMMTGTMGAVIRMDGLRANRRQLFDIGLAGPLAGLVLTIPLVCFGLKYAKPAPPIDPAIVAAGDTSELERPHYGRPLMVQIVQPWIRPDLPPDVDLAENAFYMAGWVGMLVTGLNMLPMSQLDGGHVIHALFGRRGRWIARGFLLTAIVTVIATDNYNWLAMLCVIIFLGVDHPPSANDRMPLGRLRWCLGLASLVIPIFCFMLTPIS